MRTNSNRPNLKRSSHFPNCSSACPNCSSRCPNPSRTAQLEPLTKKPNRTTISRETPYGFAFEKSSSNLSASMKPAISILIILATPLALIAQRQPELKQLSAALAQLSPHVAPEPEREQLRTQVGRLLREQIAAANRASSAAWALIDSRERWEAFRREKLAALRASLGQLPARPQIPRSLVTGRIQGDGFQIHNLVYESRHGLVVTANLYVPDPLREKMPAIVISHSHHNPKEQGELQDMGMTWARAGCYVLVPDHLGQGERRQHPFVTASDYAGQFQLGRQDYYFRYDTSLQLYLVGETLMGWLVHDLMTGIDLLVAQPGIDRSRICLLGSVAGGGDPAAVTAALDERITCVVPFNFGGPQPETRYPLPADAATSFNYSGGGSWESTRNLYRSAADGFLPWVIVASVAPRHLIHAHEFSWDRERDPVWARYQKIWGFYGAADRLASTQGFGTIQATDAPASHCNNIGPPHRKQIHEAFRRWFDIQVRPESEYSQRRTVQELTCLTPEARRLFQPRPVHEILAAMADERLAAARNKLQTAANAERKQQMRDVWSRLLGPIEPPAELKTRAGEPAVEQVAGITVRRELVESEPGILVPVMTLSRAADDQKQNRSRPLILGLASDGIAGMLRRRSDDTAEALMNGAVVMLVEVRGTGNAGQRADHGQQSAATSQAATSLMLGQPLLGGQLRDLRAVWRHVKARHPKAQLDLIVAGGSGAVPLAADAKFAFPRRIDGRPSECEPNCALLALLFALFEDDAQVSVSRNALMSYRSVLDSPFVQVPLDCVVPGVLRECDLPDLVAVLAPRDVGFEGFVDGRGRLVPAATAKAVYEPILRAYGESSPISRLDIAEAPPAGSK
jgi:dienelactone hydrolase